MIILKLYVFLFLCINLKWVTSQEDSNIFVNRWIEDIDDSVSTTFCGHDGFLNQTCQCTTDYYGSNCLTRQCRNFGVDGKSFLNQDRCICPPGFLGKNCEPVRCVDGNNAVFQQSGKTVALLATPNREMNQSWANNNNPIELVCSYTEYTRIFSLSGIMRRINPGADSCNPKYYEDPCDNATCQPLELASLRDLVTAVPPNTIIFVVSNQKLDSTDDEVSQRIIASAIAKRVQINVVLYEMITDTDSLNYLRNIATSTLGSFVKKGYEPEDAAISQGYQVIQALLQNFDSDIRPAALGLNINLPFQANSDVYISGQTEYEQSLTIISSSNQVTEVVLNTTFWKLYRISASSSLNFIRVSGQSTGSQVIISTSDRLNVYSAFTTDKDYGTLESAFPTTIAGSSYPLVSRFEYNGTVIGNYDDIRLYKGLLDSSLVTISNSFAYRPGCQFNFKTDTSCQKSDIQFLYVLSTSNKPGIVPVYCLDKEIGISTYNSFLSTPSSSSEFSIHQSFVDDAVCSAEPAVNAFGSHSFVVISPNTRDANSNLSSIDNLYRNTNSLFYQLYSYLKNTNPNQYSNYIGSLYSSSQIDNFAVETTYEYFLTKVMNFANASSIRDPAAGPIDIISHITLTLENTNLRPFSDVFVILDSPFNNSSDRSTLLKQIQSKRIRLYILYVQTYSSLSDEDYIFLNDLVVRSSGGLLSVLNSYDDVKQFFTVYTDKLVANDLILSGFSKTPRAGIILNDANLVKGNSYLLLVTNRNPTSLNSGSVNVTVSSTGPSTIPSSLLENFGGIQLFSLDIVTTGSYNISILGYSQLSNAIILESMTSQNYIGLTFANNQNILTNSIGFNLGAFQPLIYSSFNLTLANSKVLITQTTDADPSVLVYNGPVINQNTCDSSELYKYATNFKWVCSQAGGLYRVKIDLVGAVGTITRTFPLTCVSSTSSSCLNGGTYSDSDKKCVCVLGWSGDICEIPVCLNGGSQTTGNTCQCSSGYSGSHCETSTSTCSNSPSSPDFRSDISSLIIVAETNALREVYLTSGIALLGIPITVVTYSGSQANVVLTTTDGNLLSSVLNQNTNTDDVVSPNTADDFNNALNVALDAQITDRSLLVVISSQNNLQVDTNTLIRLAAKRSEIRFITTTDVTDSLTTFSLIGNSIPITVSTADKLSEFFQAYIVAFFNGLNSQKVFNVYETDIINITKEIIIPADSTDGSTDNIVLLHVFNGSWVAADDKTPSKFSSGSYNLYVFSGVKTTEDFSLSLKVAVGANKLYYSIERINYLNTAYGFSGTTDGTDEQLIIGARRGQNNVLSIYSAPLPSTLPSANPQELPYLEVREILSTGSLDAAQTVLFTRKPTGCLYTHFSSLDICQKSGVLGYQVRLNTRNSRFVTKQQQFTVTCHNTQYSNNDTTCGGNGSPNAICDCDPGFRGIDCKEPICVNGVRDVSVCRCAVPYFGQRCQTAEYTNQRAVAFVLDLVGADDYAYNETINTVKTYFEANTDDLYVMLIANVEPTNFKFQKLTEDNLNVMLDTFFIQRNENATANLTDALNQVSLSLSTLPNGTLVSADIFYLTQVGLDATDDPTTVLQTLSAFKTSAVIYSPYGKSADATIINSLKPFTSQTQNNDNYFDATKYLISVTDSSQNFITPKDPERTCAYALQSNIIVVLDYSNTTTPGVNEKKDEILTILRNKFNYINNDVDRCSSSSSTTPSFYKERSLFSVIYLYDGAFWAGNFCPSNYDSIWQSNYKGSKTTPTFSDKQLLRINAFINNAANCSCPRSTDDNTSKFLIWMPRASIDTAPNRIGNLTYEIGNSAQFVIPFYDMDTSAESTDLYYNLVEQSKLGTQAPTDYILPNAVNSEAQDIVTQLEQKMCTLAKIPGSI